MTNKAPYMTGSEVRQSFLDYFVNKGHTHVRSAPLVPGNDPTLLFTNAGMVQFKDVFVGADSRPYKRATSSQKCLRVSGKHNDLETVGRTARHHTFFEMLGNFSFGDYFKKEAIEFAWDFLTVTCALPKDRLYATVYLDDDEAAKLWAEISGLPPERIQRFGDKDNFWSMGDTGPCGPCSELHYDRGEEYACDRPDCGIDCECDRYLEIWNLVFMQYDRTKDGTMTPLPKPSVDTGMGLERLVSVIQGKETNYETDLILPIIEEMAKLTEADYLADPVTDVSFRVIGDHVRAASFLIADNVMPGNEGRGYVLRRILRRALRHGRMLGVKGPFAYGLTGTVVDTLGDAYPELIEFRDIIKRVVLAEENSFSATLDHGMKLIAEMIEAAKESDNVISGPEAFKLYDTFGFPMDLAREIVEDVGVSIDFPGFEKAMEAQKIKARKSWKGGSDTTVNPVYAKSAGDSGPTEFVGYDETAVTDSEVLAIVKSGDTVEILLDKTPFYAESGGQAADIGIIENESFRGRVTDTQKPDGAHVFHTVVVETGAIKSGDTLSAHIDNNRRQAIRLNHSATHLLHAALRSVLGSHVKQGGSSVGPDRLRFDYTHFTAPTVEEISLIERRVVQEILSNNPITTDIKNMDEAVLCGAMALFGEKYSEKVRVVTMGDFSIELCGGSHATATGDIGLFKITSESALSAGVRRIEAVTGFGAYDTIVEQANVLNAVGALLKSPPLETPDRLAKQAERLKELEKENRKLKEKFFTKEIGNVEAIDVGGIAVVTEQLDGADAEALRSFVDNNKNSLGSGVVIAAASSSGKVLLAVGVTNDLTKRVKAGDIVRELAKMVGGGGGGRPDFAQAGGKNPEKLPEAMDAVAEIVSGLLSPRT